MQPKSDQEYQKLLTDVIRKQIVILGPAITLAKARNVTGLNVSDDGTVTGINGNPQLITQQLVEQFMELSGLIVKKTMEPLLANYPELAGSAPIVTPTKDSSSTASSPAAPTPPSAPVRQNPVSTDNNTTADTKT